MLEPHQWSRFADSKCFPILVVTRTTGYHSNPGSEFNQVNVQALDEWKRILLPFCRESLSLCLSHCHFKSLLDFAHPWRASAGIALVPGKRCLGISDNNHVYILAQRLSEVPSNQLNNYGPVLLVRQVRFAKNTCLGCSAAALAVENTEDVSIVVETSFLQD